MERPDYIKNFEKPINTEIKCINGRWYLYERINKWDKTNKKNKKISGSILGKITPEGFVPSTRNQRAAAALMDLPMGSGEATPRTPEAPESTQAVEAPESTRDSSEAETPLPFQLDAEPGEQPVHHSTTLIPPPYAPGTTLPDINRILSDTVESGAIAYLASRSETLMNLLQKYFPGYWVFIYCVVLIRTIYHCPMRDMQYHFTHSVLGYVYDKIDLMRGTVGLLMRILGSQRATLREFMLDAAHGKRQYAIVDGHRMLTSSKTMPLAEKGYDSQQRYHPQLNVMYMFTTNGDGTFGTPSYYKAFAGSTIDSIGLKDLVAETKLDEEVTLIGDKGTGSADRFEQIVKTGAKYIIPIKRGSKEVKELKEPQFFCPETMPGSFKYNNRPIYYIEIVKSDYRLIIFLDMVLKTCESSTICDRKEKKTTSEEEKAAATIEKLTGDIGKRQNDVQKKSEALERAKKTLQRAEEQTKKAEDKVLAQEQVVAKARERVENATAERERREAKGACSNRIEGAQRSVSIQQGRLDSYTAELLKLRNKLQERRTLEADARDEVNNIINEIAEKKSDIENENAALDTVNKHLKIWQYAADWGLPVYKDGDELAVYSSDTDDFLDGGKREIGTLTIRTNIMDTPAPQIYRLYKLRQGIEQFFKTYDNTLCQDVSYLREQFSEEGWLFLNHLCSILAFDTMEQIHEAGLTKDLSVQGWYSRLRSLQISKLEGEWTMPSLKKDMEGKCKKLGFDPTDLSRFNIKLKI